MGKFIDIPNLKFCIKNMRFQEGLKLLPDKCANLIICDPPYFRIKGDFDFKMTWEEWQQMHEDLARECKRVLADNGTLFLWGHAKRIAYQQVIFDRWFTLENSLVWSKTECQTMKQDFSAARCFAPVTERLLMYSTGSEPGEWDQTGWEKVKLDVANFQPLRNYFEQLQKWVGCTKKHFIDIIGQSADHCFRWNSSQWDLPTTETYTQLIQVFKINNWQGFREYEDLRREYEDLRREYEDLRREYEDLRRPFDNYLKLTDVWRFSQEGHITGQYDHETVKPEKLTRAIILTCSRPGDLVVVPFSGSGTECAMSLKEGRRAVGFEIDPKHVQTSVNRCKEQLTQPQMF